MKDKGCGLQVLVGGKALREYTHDGLTVVEARLDLPETREVTENRVTPHGVEEDAHWRVTPYELLLTNDNPFDVGVWVYIDGEKMHGWFPVLRGQRALVRGFAYERSMKELLFSLPCFPGSRGLCDERKRDMGTIRASFVRVTPRAAPYAPPALAGGGGEFVQASKSDARDAGKTVTAATTRLGGTVYEWAPQRVEHDHHETVAELRIDYKTHLEMEALGIAAEAPAADPPAAAELPELLVSSVSSLLGSVRAVYGVDLFDHAGEVGAKALANDCKLMPRTPLSGPQGAAAVGLPRSVVEKVPVSSSAFVQSPPVSACDRDQLRETLGGAHVFDPDAAGERDRGLSHALAAALLLSDRLHFVVEALWNPGQQQQQQSDAEAVPQRLQAVARSFGVRLSLVEGRSRWEYAPYAVTAKTRDVAVGWAGDRYVALVGSMAVPLIRSNKRSDPDPAPQNPLRDGDVIDLT
eukprot:m51a1_g7167 hypothetical protein (466) ;mRNA; f:57188-58647